MLHPNFQIALVFLRRRQFSFYLKAFSFSFAISSLFSILVAFKHFPFRPWMQVSPRQIKIHFCCAQKKCTRQESTATNALLAILSKVTIICSFFFQKNTCWKNVCWRHFRCYNNLKWRAELCFAQETRKSFQPAMRPSLENLVCQFGVFLFHDFFSFDCDKKGRGRGYFNRIS